MPASVVLCALCVCVSPLLFFCLSVCLSAVCLSVCLSVHLSGARAFSHPCDKLGNLWLVLDLLLWVHIVDKSCEAS